MVGIGGILIDGGGGGAGAGGGGLHDAYAELVHQAASGTNGGTFTQDAWQTRPLTTELFDTDDFVTLAANQFTLQPGTYFIEAYGAVVAVNAHQTRIRDVTNGATVAVGEMTTAAAAAGAAGESWVSGRVVVAAETDFELQHRCQATQANIGFGQAASGWGEVMIYARVRIWREVELA